MAKMSKKERLRQAREKFEQTNHESEDEAKLRQFAEAQNVKDHGGSTVDAKDPEGLLQPSTEDHIPAHKQVEDNFDYDNASLEEQLTHNYNTNHPLDDGDIHSIVNRLRTYSADTGEVLIKAMTDENKVKDLVKVLESNAGFRGYQTYGNHDLAEIAANEIASYGLINQLVSFQPKNGSDRITDISFNGKFMVLATNNKRFRYGRRKGHEDEPIINDKVVENMVARFSNKEGDGGKNFGPGNPSLDAFSNNLRLNAIDPSLSGSGITMSLRVSRASLALNRSNFKQFAPNVIYGLLTQFIKGGANIMISGATGTGKTELLKLLVDEIGEDDKIIMIEDVQETHLQTIYPNKNIYDWITTPQFTIKDHVKGSLRNQPDWVLVSETRGAEAYEMYQLFLTGHPVMTTLHATSNEAVPDRLYGMCSMSDFKIPEQLKEDLYTYLNIGVHITRKVVNGKVYRFADNICEFGDPNETYPNSEDLVYPHGIHTLYACELIAEEDGKGNIRDSHGNIVDAPERIVHFNPPTQQMVQKIYENAGVNLYDYYNKVSGSDYNPHHMLKHTDSKELERQEEEQLHQDENEIRNEENEQIRDLFARFANYIKLVTEHPDSYEELKKILPDGSDEEMDELQKQFDADHQNPKDGDD